MGVSARGLLASLSGPDFGRSGREKRVGGGRYAEEFCCDPLPLWWAAVTEKDLLGSDLQRCHISPQPLGSWASVLKLCVLASAAAFW